VISFGSPAWFLKRRGVARNKEKIRRARAGSFFGFAPPTSEFVHPGFLDLSGQCQYSIPTKPTLPLPVPMIKRRTLTTPYNLVYPLYL